jgi:hypothetical protein
MVWRENAGETRAWAVLSVAGETALVADFLGRERDGSDLPALFSAVAAEAARLGASRLVFWESPGGPAANLLQSLSGDRRDAGFPFVARSFDDAATDEFARNAHFVPSLYDLV